MNKQQNGRPNQNTLTYLTKEKKRMQVNAIDDKLNNLRLTQNDTE